MKENNLAKHIDNFGEVEGRGRERGGIGGTATHILSISEMNLV